MMLNASTKETKAPIFVGVDMSILHGALVAIDLQGKQVASKVLSTTQKDEKSGCSRIPDAILNLSDKTRLAVERLSWLKAWLQGVVHEISSAVGPGKALHFSLEDYAFSKAQGAHQLGEIGGVARLILATFGTLRLHDPSSVKAFACNSGGASKDEVMDGVKARWGVTPPALAPRTREDFCDAYTLAEMMRLEWKVRYAHVDLKDLSEEDRGLFLRTTPAVPVNLLARPLVHLN